MLGDRPGNVSVVCQSGAGEGKRLTGSITSGRTTEWEGKDNGEKDKEGKGQRWKREGKGDSYEEQPLYERIRVRREKKVNKLWEVRQGS